jgi:hypothetical protein
MDGGVKENGEEQYTGIPENAGYNTGRQDMGNYIPEIIYMPRSRRKAWIWITAAALACAAAVCLIFAFSSEPGYREIKGNAGVVALYDMLLEQQKAQESLSDGLMKELKQRIGSGPFEISSEIKLNTDSFSNAGIDNITIGFDAKYDMKDFGVKLNALGIEVLGAYLIGNDVVIESMGKAGSLSLSADIPDKSMPLGERIKALLPFLPENTDIFVDLLEKVSLSVPDEYTKNDKEQVYSPKEEKNVLMSVTTVTLDAEAVKKVIGNFKDGFEGDRVLSRKIQNTVDSFTKFAGLDAASIEDWLSELGRLAQSEDIKDINVTLSVYQRQGTYVGADISFSSGDTNGEVTYICEYSGKEEYASSVYNINGVKQETMYHYIYQGNKVKIDGSITAAQGESLGNTMQTVDGTVEYVKSGANEYKLAADLSVNGDIQSDLQDIGKSLSFTMGINADIKTGNGLGTLKESSDWNGIYNEEWGSLDDLFGGYFDGYNYLFPNNPSTA